MYPFLIYGILWRFVVIFFYAHIRYRNCYTCCMKQLLLILLLPCMVHAQETAFNKTIYVGYTPNIPNMWGGFSFGVKTGPGVLFFDLQMGVNEKGLAAEEYDNFYGNISIEEVKQWGDPLINVADYQMKKYMAMGLSYAYPVSNRWAVYGSVGGYSYTEYNRTYKSYSDPSFILGDLDGQYWIADHTQSHDKKKEAPYGGLGIMYKSEKGFWAKAGGETHGFGATVGIGISF